MRPAPTTAVVATLLLLSSLPALAQEAAPGVPDRFDLWLGWITRAVEAVGIAIIVLGALLASLRYLWRLLRAGPREGLYHGYRADLGRAILLGLEFLVAADIVGTVAVDPTPRSLAVLAGIVLIRTFLSFSLEVEIEGRWPWQRGRQRD